MNLTAHSIQLDEPTVAAILDGLADLPKAERTEVEAAHTIAAMICQGLIAGTVEWDTASRPRCLAAITALHEALFPTEDDIERYALAD